MAENVMGWAKYRIITLLANVNANDAVMTFTDMYKASFYTRRNIYYKQLCKNIYLIQLQKLEVGPHLYLWCPAQAQYVEIPQDFGTSQNMDHYLHTYSQYS